MPRPTVRPIRREQILDVAHRLITDRGWTGLTFATICQEAAVSNGVLTYHFVDKDDLLFALLQREIRRRRERGYGPFVTGEGSLRERLTALAHCVPGEQGEWREFRLLALHFLAQAVDRSEIAERFREVHEETVQEVAGRLAQDVTEGTVTRDPTVAAQMVVGVVTGFGMATRMFGAQPPHDEIVELLYGYLTSGKWQVASGKWQVASDE